MLEFKTTAFQNFIYEELNIDISDEKYNYRSGSKANRLRGFWKEEDNFKVVKLIEKLLEYWNTEKLIEQNIITTEEEKLVKECQKIVGRLQGDKVKNIKKKLVEKEKISTLRHDLLLEFERSAALQTLAEKRQRDFLLEGLLKNSFSLYEIPTQKSFSRNEGGEQIDGAFKLEGWYYLVE